jgi:antitoxin component YwqK of YwqJK toxin-antitoxin module/F0F1-type ATP synthase membrane subunit c/vacuolar-type H+-ATPase subunit K
MPLVSAVRGQDFRAAWAGCGLEASIIRAEDQGDVTMTNDDAVLVLLRQLEVDNRVMKRTGGAVLAVALLICCAAAIGMQEPGIGQGNAAKSAIQDVLRTRRIELADARGAVVAVLQAAEERDEPGWLTDFHDNGRRKWRAQIANNRYEGQYTAWWPNGLKSEEGTFVKGRKHGLFVTYHENGQPQATGAWSDGLRTGIWSLWHDNGQKQGEGLFEDDRKTGVWKEWHKNGRPASTCAFDRGLQTGRFQSWHDNGERREESEYRDGVKTGSFKEWHANGQPSCEGTLDALGKATGEWKYWRRDGTVDDKTGTYQFGKRVK